MHFDLSWRCSLAVCYKYPGTIFLLFPVRASVTHSRRKRYPAGFSLLALEQPKPRRDGAFRAVFRIQRTAAAAPVWKIDHLTLCFSGVSWRGARNAFETSGVRRNYIGLSSKVGSSFEKVKYLELFSFFLLGCLTLSVKVRHFV